MVHPSAQPTWRRLLDINKTVPSCQIMSIVQAAGWSSSGAPCYSRGSLPLWELPDHMPIYTTSHLHQPPLHTRAVTFMWSNPIWVTYCEAFCTHHTTKPTMILEGVKWIPPSLSHTANTSQCWQEIPWGFLSIVSHGVTPAFLHPLDWFQWWV